MCLPASSGKLYLGGHRLLFRVMLYDNTIAHWNYILLALQLPKSSQRALKEEDELSKGVAV